MYIYIYIYIYIYNGLDYLQQNKKKGCSTMWSFSIKRFISLLYIYAVRLVLEKAKRDHVTTLFRKFHWLPLQAKIDYKICVLCFKCINKTAPSYLSDLLEQYVPSRLLRSGSQNLLKIPPRANKKSTERHSSTVPHIFGIRYHLISEKPRVKVNLKMTLRPTFSSPIFVFEFLLIY